MKQMSILMPNFDKRGGLITVIAQDYRTREILMVAYTDRAGYLETFRTGYAVYYSTSLERKGRWLKGETSGDTQLIRDVRLDCDGDAAIYVVTQNGVGACHTKNRTCFYRSAIGSTLQAGMLSVEIHEVCDSIGDRS